jgi:DNA polymerase
MGAFGLPLGSSLHHNLFMEGNPKEPGPREQLENWISILGSDAPLPLPQKLPQKSPSFTRQKEKKQILQDLIKRIQTCESCSLAHSRKQVVISDGDPNAEYFFVGEAPGAQEDAQGLPFVGAAGQLLTKIIEQGIKIPRKKTFIANILKCRPPQNRTPLPEEIKACSPFLLEQIQCVSPKILIALGATAARFFLKTQAPMRSLRGRVHHFLDIPLVVTWHPSYLLRRPEAKAETWKDIQLAMKVLEERNKAGQRT